MSQMRVEWSSKNILVPKVYNNAAFVYSVVHSWYSRTEIYNIPILNLKKTAENSQTEHQSGRQVL